MIDISEVKEKYEQACFFNTIPDSNKFHKYSNLNKVLDENKTVKWNREEVERLNNAYTEEHRRLCSIKTKMLDEALHYVYLYINQETGLNREKCCKIWHYVYDEYHAYMNDVWIYLEEITDLVSGLLT